MSIRFGEPAPDFKAMAVVDKQSEEISLSSFHGHYVLLFFWPPDFTFACPTEIVAFGDKAGALRARNSQAWRPVSFGGMFSRLLAWRLDRKAYSMDLRRQVLRMCDAGRTTREVARAFEVSESWIRNLKQCWREDNTVAPRPSGVRRHGHLKPNTCSNFSTDSSNALTQFSNRCLIV